MNDDSRDDDQRADETPQKGGFFSRMFKRKPEEPGQEQSQSEPAKPADSPAEPPAPPQPAPPPAQEAPPPPGKTPPPRPPNRKKAAASGRA
ncbi:hypothetical protein HML84_13050 [Alcanivorax sp. IO_7]|nr:hypothetical protein HML84_13050 [Alcanivorax sp. IO_7]